VCSEEHADLQTDLADLEAKENQIDDLIRNAKLQIKLLTEDKQYAYVSYQVGLTTGTYFQLSAGVPITPVLLLRIRCRFRIWILPICLRFKEIFEYKFSIL
jgi:hypothetical protein